MPSSTFSSGSTSWQLHGMPAQVHGLVRDPWSSDRNDLLSPQSGLDSRRPGDDFIPLPIPWDSELPSFSLLLKRLDGGKQVLSSKT